MGCTSSTSLNFVDVAPFPSRRSVNQELILQDYEVGSEQNLRNTLNEVNQLPDKSVALLRKHLQKNVDSPLFPQSHRWWTWQFLTGGNTLYSRYPQLYLLLLKKGKCPDKFDTVIRNDAPRTMPTIPFFGSNARIGPGQHQLYRILTAYCHLDPEVGYTQGMNFIVALLLLGGLSEEAAFYSFTSLMINHHFRGLYMASFPMLPAIQKRVEKEIRRLNPQIIPLLQSEELSLPMLTSSWILSFLLSSPLPISTILAVCDLIFLELQDTMPHPSLATAYRSLKDEFNIPRSRASTSTVSSVNPTRYNTTYLSRSSRFPISEGSPSHSSQEEFTAKEPPVDAPSAPEKNVLPTTTRSHIHPSTSSQDSASASNTTNLLASYDVVSSELQVPNSTSEHSLPVISEAHQLDTYPSTASCVPFPTFPTLPTLLQPSPSILRSTGPLSNTSITTSSLPTASFYTMSQCTPLGLVKACVTLVLVHAPLLIMTPRSTFSRSTIATLALFPWALTKKVADVGSRHSKRLSTTIKVGLNRAIDITTAIATGSGARLAPALEYGGNDGDNGGNRRSSRWDTSRKKSLFGNTRSKSASVGTFRSPQESTEKKAGKQQASNQAKNIQGALGSTHNASNGEANASSSSTLSESRASDPTNVSENEPHNELNGSQRSATKTVPSITTNNSNIPGRSDPLEASRAAAEPSKLAIPASPLDGTNRTPTRATRRLRSRSTSATPTRERTGLFSDIDEGNSSGDITKNAVSQQRVTEHDNPLFRVESSQSQTQRKFTMFQSVRVLPSNASPMQLQSSNRRIKPSPLTILPIVHGDVAAQDDSEIRLEQRGALTLDITEIIAEATSSASEYVIVQKEDVSSAAMPDQSTTDAMQDAIKVDRNAPSAAHTSAGAKSTSSAQNRPPSGSAVQRPFNAATNTTTKNPTNTAVSLSQLEIPSFASFPSSIGSSQSPRSDTNDFPAKQTSRSALPRHVWDMQTLYALFKGEFDQTGYLEPPVTQTWNLPIIVHASEQKPENTTNGSRIKKSAQIEGNPAQFKSNYPQGRVSSESISTKSALTEGNSSVSLQRGVQKIPQRSVDPPIRARVVIEEMDDDSSVANAPHTSTTASTSARSSAKRSPVDKEKSVRTRRVQVQSRSKGNSHTTDPDNVSDVVIESVDLSKNKADGNGTEELDEATNVAKTQKDASITDVAEPKETVFPSSEPNKALSEEGSMAVPVATEATNSIATQSLSPSPEQSEALLDAPRVAWEALLQSTSSSITGTSDTTDNQNTGNNNKNRDPGSESYPWEVALAMHRRSANNAPDGADLDSDLEDDNVVPVFPPILRITPRKVWHDFGDIGCPSSQSMATSAANQRPNSANAANTLKIGTSSRRFLGRQSKRDLGIAASGNAPETVVQRQPTELVEDIPFSSTSMVTAALVPTFLRPLLFTRPRWHFPPTWTGRHQIVHVIYGHTFPESVLQQLRMFVESPPSPSESSTSAESHKNITQKMPRIELAIGNESDQQFPSMLSSACFAVRHTESHEVTLFTSSDFNSKDIIGKLLSLPSFSASDSTSANPNQESTPSPRNNEASGSSSSLTRSATQNPTIECHDQRGDSSHSQCAGTTTNNASPNKNEALEPSGTFLCASVLIATCDQRPIHDWSTPAQFLRSLRTLYPIIGSK